MSNETTIVKIGGNVIDNAQALAAFVKDFAALPGRKILVHGGGKEATRLGVKLGIEAQMIDGRRVTSRDTLDVVTMTYAGLINKRIVSALQAEGCNAIGLTGADGNAITATRRNPEPIDYGYVGDIKAEGINAKLFTDLLNAGLTPVVCAIMHDGRGTLLNCNADSVASAIAIGMAQVCPADLVFCFEKKGVLRDINDPDSVIANINRETYAGLRADNVIAQGMIPKIDGALAAVDKGVRSVTIRQSENLSTPSGTKITA